ncbi:hypothetical protein [Gorillibacterium massiliense]|uniref:hypothetical protein n=1 Tax=Gorillibacterium massiliense TaxID=1280390 RepID=UPI0004ADB877|nr:hypothetical protein [Gorillibacterium massiliense]
MSDRLLSSLIGLAIAVVIMVCGMFWAFSRFGIWERLSIQDPVKTVLDSGIIGAKSLQKGPGGSSTADLRDTDRSTYKFNFAKAGNIDAQKLVYQGKNDYLSSMSEDIRDEALKSAISSKAEVADLLERLHRKFDEMVGYGNVDHFKPNAAGQTPETAKEAWDNILNRLTTQPDIYNQMAIATDDPDAKKDFANLASLTVIATDKRDAQALIYMHRIVHDLDYWVYNSPGSAKNPDKFGAAHAFKKAPTSQIKTIEAYIKSGGGS